MQILYKDKNIIAVYKTVGMPSQSDPTGDADALTLTAKQLSDMKERSELWLVHRLDRVVGGVLVFARNKKYAALLSELVASHGIEKEYLAVVDGKVEDGVMTDLIYKDATRSKAFVVDRPRKGVKEASLECTTLATLDGETGTRTLVRVKLHTGRFHQIRVQLSSRGTPITGDGKYGSRDSAARHPALFAYHLGFFVEGKRVDIYKYPETGEYPWNNFSDVISECEK